MKLSISRAALIQWLALAVDWNRFVTCIHTHLMEPSSRSRIIFVTSLPTLGLSVLAGSFPTVSLRSRWLGVSTTLSRGGEASGEVRATVAERRQVDDAVGRSRETLVRDPRPEHRVHLRHVRAPEDHRVGELDVVIVPGGLVDPENLHESSHRRSHAVTGVGGDVVRAPARFWPP